MKSPLARLTSTGVLVSRLALLQVCMILGFGLAAVGGMLHQPPTLWQVLSMSGAGLCALGWAVGSVLISFGLRDAVRSVEAPPPGTVA